MRAVSYLRALPAATLEAQQRAFLDYCERAGLEVGPGFTETSDDPSAPEFRRMLRELALGPRGFTVVVVSTLGVLGSRVQEQAKRYLQLDALGLPLRIADGSDPDETLVEAWSQRGADERRREAVREGMRGRALRGEVLGRAPYGYRVVNRHLRIDPEEGPVVREIFRRYLEEGEGVRRIARHLNEHEARTRRGGPWSMVSVRSVLRNPVYVGTYRRLGITVVSEHEALVRRDQFHAAQARLASRRTSFGEQQRHEYLLASLAHCGYCGNRLIGVHRRRGTAAEPREYVYYQCESRTNQSRCDYHTRRAEELEAAVREQLEASAPAVDTGAEAVRAADVDTQRLDARRQALRRELAALLEKRAAGQWTGEQLRRVGGALALEDLAAEERAEAAERVRRTAADASAQASHRADELRRLVEQWDALPFEERRTLLRDVVADVVVTDDAVQVRVKA